MANGTAPDLQAIRDEIMRVYNSTEDYTKQELKPFKPDMTKEQILNVYYDGAVPANDIPVLEPTNQPIQASTPKTTQKAPKMSEMDKARQIGAQALKDAKSGKLEQKKAYSANEQRDMERAMSAIANQKKQSVTSGSVNSNPVYGDKVTNGNVNTLEKNKTNSDKYDDRGFRKTESLIDEWTEPNRKLTKDEVAQAKSMINKYEQTETGKKNDNATTLIFDEEHPDGISVPVYAVDDNGNYDPSKLKTEDEKAYEQKLYELKEKISDSESALRGAMEVTPFVSALGKRADKMSGTDDYERRRANAQKQNPVAYYAGLIGQGIANQAAGQFLLGGTQYADKLGNLVKADKGLAGAIAKEALMDAPIDIATDIIPTLAADIASGKSAKEVIKNTAGNIGLNGVLNLGGGIVANLDDVIKAFKPQSVLDDSLKSLDGADLFSEMAKKGKEQPLEGIDYLAKQASDKRTAEALQELNPLEMAAKNADIDNAVKAQNQAVQNVEDLSKQIPTEEVTQPNVNQVQLDEITNGITDAQIRENLENIPQVDVKGTKTVNKALDNDINTLVNMFGRQTDNTKVVELKNALNEYAQTGSDEALNNAKAIANDLDEMYNGATYTNKRGAVQDFTDNMRGTFSSQVENYADRLKANSSIVDKKVNAPEIDNAINELFGRYDLSDADAKAVRQFKQNINNLIAEQSDENWQAVINSLSELGKKGQDLSEFVSSYGKNVKTNPFDDDTLIKIVDDIEAYVKNPENLVKANADDAVKNIAKADEAALNTGDTNLSKVYTNSLSRRNNVLDMADEVNKVNAQYNVHHSPDVIDTAKNRFMENAEGWEKAYASGKESITSDVDVSTAMLLLKDKADQIAELTGKEGAEEELSRLIKERDALALKLRSAGTEKGQAIKAFDYFNGTADGAILNAERMYDKAGQKWAKKNPKVAKSLDELSSTLVSAIKKNTNPEVTKVAKEPLTLEQIKSQVKNTLNTEYKDIGKNFNDEDIDFIANLIDNGANSNELSSMLKTKMSTGIWDIPQETIAKVNSLFDEAKKFNPNSKQRVDLETQAFWELANCTNEKASLGEKFATWRYLAMLGNPKTHVRNMIGNVLFGGVTRASDTVAAAMEGVTDTISKATRKGKGIERTKSILTPKDTSLVKACSNDATENAYRQLSGSKWADSKGVRNAIQEQKEVFNSKLIRGYNKLNNAALSGEDTMAMKAKYKTSLAGYLKANGLDETVFKDEQIYNDLLKKSRSELLSDTERQTMNALSDKVKRLQKGREYAIGRAEYAAFHEDNAAADWLQKVSSEAPGAAKYLVEGVLPFKKTPANILKSGLEYSPLNLLNDAYHAVGLKKGTSNAADLFESISKTVTGTGLIGLGAWLYDKGYLNMSDDETKWQDALVGKQNYSIKLPINGKDYTFTIDFAAPSVMPVFLGGQIKKMYDANQENKPENFFSYLSQGLQAASKLFSPIAETSMLSGVSDTLDSLSSDNKVDALFNLALTTGTGYLTQGIPTVLGQAARVIDNTRRSTYSDANDPLARSLDKKWEKVQNKIPFYSMKNEPYISAYGEEQKNSPFETGIPALDTLGNTAYQFLSPSYIQKVNERPADINAETVYKDPNGGNANVFAGINNSKKVGGQRISKEENTIYAKARGDANLELRNMLANNEEFTNLSPSLQSDVLTSLDAFADKVGESKINPDMEASNKLYKVYNENDGDMQAVVDYILADNNPYGLKADTYQTMKDNNEDFSKWDGYKEALEENGIEDSKGAEEAWLNGGTDAVAKEAEYKKALKDLGLSDSKARAEAYAKGGVEGLEKMQAQKDAAINAGFVTEEGNANEKAYQNAISVLGNDSSAKKYANFANSMSSKGYTKQAEYIPQLETMQMSDTDRGKYAFLMSGKSMDDQAGYAKSAYEFDGYQGYYYAKLLKEVKDYNGDGKHNKYDRIQQLYDWGFDKGSEDFKFYSSLKY